MYPQIGQGSNLTPTSIIFDQLCIFAKLSVMSCMSKTKIVYKGNITSYLGNYDAYEMK